MSDTTTTFADCLRELGVAGQVAEFDTDVPTAAAAAEQLGCELGAIANSLVFTVDDAPLLIIASGAHRVDTKRVARLLDANTPLSDAAWMKENLGRATMALPNGYCGLPLQQTCPHANACLTCPVFITTPDFLAEHLAQLRTTKELIITVQAKGHTRLAEMNQRVATNLENIIDTIQAPDIAEAEDES